MTQIYDTVIKLSLVETGVLSGISAIVAQLARGTGEVAIMAWLESIRTTNWNEEITKALQPAIVAIKAWFANLGTAIMDSLKGMWENMKGALGSLFHASYSGGGFGGGGGITNAEWSGGGGGAGAALSRGERAQYASMIRQYGGDQAENLLRIYGTEGAGGYVGDYGTSFGPFQSHIGGLSSRPGMGGKGIGDQMLAAGIDPRDKSTVRAQIEWMKRYGEKHGGYSSNIWHGLRGHGGLLRASPHLPPSRRDQTVVINHITNLDGKQIAKNTVKHIVKSATYPTSVGLADSRGQFLGPSAESFA